MMVTVLPELINVVIHATVRSFQTTSVIKMVCDQSYCMMVGKLSLEDAKHLAMSYPNMSTTENASSLSFLVQTNEPNIENNLSPFVFLYSDENLFIFANNRAILFEYSNNLVVNTYPTMLDGQPRSYPSTGSVVLLPLWIKQETVAEVEVLVCGGTPKEAFVNAVGI
ncbi:aldehyde oxidase GLOX1-like protein [Tanacetum coccineum]